MRCGGAARVELEVSGTAVRVALTAVEPQRCAAWPEIRTWRPHGSSSRRVLGNASRTAASCLRRPHGLPPPVSSSDGLTAAHSRHHRSHSFALASLAAASPLVARVLAVLSFRSVIPPHLGIHPDRPPSTYERPA